MSCAEEAILQWLLNDCVLELVFEETRRLHTSLEPMAMQGERPVPRSYCVEYDVSERAHGPFISMTQPR